MDPRNDRLENGVVVLWVLCIDAALCTGGLLHAAAQVRVASMTGYAIVGALSFAGIWAWKSGYRRVVARAQVWGLAALLVISAPFFGGFSGPTFLAWPTVIVLAAISVGLRHTLAVAAVSIADGLLMFVLHRQGWQPWSDATDADMLMTRLGGIVTVGVVCSQAVGQLRASLAEAQTERARSEQMVKERDVELARREKTERLLKHAVDAALQASDAKSRFLANMSHELRTPLNAIIGYSEMLLEETDDPDAEEDLHRIESAGRHLLNLISDILDLSKIEAGQMVLEIDAVELGRVVEQVADAIRPAVRRNGSQLVLDVDELPRILTDRTRCYQVLLNLASNAAKFTENGTITIEVRAELGDWFVVTVRDTGIGIAPQELDRLFERFVQADASTTRKYGGTGLGLVLSRRFTEILGGELLVESTPGVGSAFHVRLPCIAPARTGATMLVPETAPTERPPLAMLPA